MIPIPVSTNTVKALGGWVGSIVQWKERHDKAKQQQIDAALNALLDAVTSTRKYLALVREHPEKQSITKQEAITKKWIRVSEKIRTFDSGIADVCFLKAEYWSDREGWDAAGKDHYLIDLDKISEFGRQALFSK